MKKTTYLCILAASFCFALAGCRKNNPSAMADAAAEASGQVDLLVWGAEEDEALLNQIFESFQQKYQGEANFNITFSPQSESNCMDALMNDLENGADVFAFADDQLNTLVAAGALTPVEPADTIKSANLPEAVHAACVGDTLYAYPLTADNGYFLYYNKRYFTEADITSLERMLEIAAAEERQITMDWSSGWYVYSFFGNTGLEVGLNDDGITNFCTWNGTEGPIRGTDIAQSMLNLAENPGFLNTTDENFLKGVQNGTVIAGVSGVWNAMAVEEAWGSDYGAAKLPSYTCAGQQIQMSSYSGYKLIGVNAYSASHEWASLLAEWITNEANQKLRFELRGQGPANKNAAASQAVQSSPAIAALLSQSEFSTVQRLGGNFWDPVSAFAGNMAAGNPDGQSLQEQLDKMVEAITAP